MKMGGEKMMGVMKRGRRRSTTLYIYSRQSNCGDAVKDFTLSGNLLS